MRGRAFTDDLGQTFPDTALSVLKKTNRTQHLKEQAQLLPLLLPQCDHGYDLLHLCRFLPATRVAMLI